MNSETKQLRCGHEVFDAEQCHYCDYIQNPLIEELMRPKDNAGVLRDFSHPDEFQFILVHQSCELSFEGYLFELNRSLNSIAKDDFETAIECVERCRSWILIAARQLQHLVDHLTPKDFAYFRDLLSPASGAESIRFRLIELSTGLRPNSPYVSHRGKLYGFRDFLDRGPTEGVGRPKTRWWTPAMSEASERPSLASAFEESLIRNGFSEDHKALLNADTPLSRLGWALVRLERGILSVRKVHLNAARRHIAEDSGTGHTDGVAYLRAVLETARCFPELTAAAEQLDREQVKP